MPKKVDGYDVERREVLNKYLELLGINENNKEICLNDIDEKPDLIKKLDDLDVEIKKYYIISGWSCYIKKNLKRKYYSVLKSLLNEFKIENKQYTLTIKKRVKDGIMNYKRVMFKVEI